MTRMIMICLRRKRNKKSKEEKEEKEKRRRSEHTSSHKKGNEKEGLLTPMNRIYYYIQSISNFIRLINDHC